MSLETLSGPRHPTPSAPTPALRWGLGKAAGKPERAPRGPSAAPPGAARGRPAPSAGGHRVPVARPDGGHSHAPAGRPEPPPRRLERSRLEGRRLRRPPARLSRSSLPARALGPVDPLLPPRAPCLAEPVLTRSRGRAAQPGLLPALPPRGPAAAAPGRNWAEMPPPSRASSVRATCSLGKVGAAKGRGRRGGGGSQAGRDPCPSRRQGRVPLPLKSGPQLWGGKR